MIKELSAYLESIKDITTEDKPLKIKSILTGVL